MIDTRPSPVDSWQIHIGKIKKKITSTMESKIKDLKFNQGKVQKLNRTIIRQKKIEGSKTPNLYFQQTSSNYFSHTTIVSTCLITTSSVNKNININQEKVKFKF